MVAIEYNGYSAEERLEAHTEASTTYALVVFGGTPLEAGTLPIVGSTPQAGAAWACGWTWTWG